MSKVEKLLNKSSGKPAQDDSEAQTGGDSVTKIPPIRSFSTRRRQYTSAANLQTDGVDSSSHEQSPLRQTPSETIAHTIQELERLLAEAVQIAEMAAGVEDKHIKTETIERRPGSPSRRPTEGITEKVNKYLGEVLAKSREILPSADRSHGHVHVAQTDSSEPNAATEVPRDPPRDEDPCDREDCNPENLQLLPPEPVADPLGGKQPKLSKRTSSGQSSNPKRSVKFLEPPVVGPRTTSARRPSPIRSTPILQLNDIEVDEKEAEVKDSQGRPENPPRRRSGHERHFSDVFRIDSRQGSMNLTHGGPYTYKIDLNGARHVDIPDKPDEIDLHQTCRHSPVARNWPIARKRFAALVSCINTACLGLLLGIYSGEVPAIQYVIVDLDRSMILGNVFLYCGLVIPTLVFWPLPLLHGRKPYTIAALALSLCLQIPQGLMVISFRSPDMARYRVILLLSRGLSGIVFGFANINNLGTLLDVFGASLQSSDSHETAADVYDVRRHGGGMGVWLAIWSWCSIGSIGMGFVIGALIISGSSVDWGFWVSLVLLMGVLLLNIVAPEVRRSAFRRTIAEMIGEGGSYSRVARGEVKLHLTGNGPYWWGEEVKAGLQLSWKMIKQPGFLVLSIYTAWVYAQFTLILMLLGALASTSYQYRPVDVGLCVLSLALGSALAIPFERASWLSRARYQPPRTDSMTFERVMLWTSHTVRRSIIMVFLPLAAIGYALTSKGPAFPVAVPCVFAGLVGYASNLAIAECYALLMQAFDTSDLQPGMTGRPARPSIMEQYRDQRTNFSCYPRVSAGMAVTQAFKFVFGAVSTAICGRVERRFGARQAAVIVAAVLLALTLVVTAVLVRWKSVQMIPRRQEQGRDADGWEPVVIGDPSGFARKISLLDAGKQTRWSEIRRRNHLESGLTGG